MFKSRGHAIIRLYNIFIRVPQERSMATLSDLTPRELEILQLVLAGWTNKAIAAEIYVCEKTVEFHLHNIYAKVGVRTRNLASVWAVRQEVKGEAKQLSS